MAAAAHRSELRASTELGILRVRGFTGDIGATGAVLYSGAVVIPLFTQSILGYTATWAGLILSPGGIAVILLIPVVGQLMRVIQTRIIIAAGFFIMGCAFVYSSRLAVNIDFKTLVMMRSAQTAGLAFLFVPISTIAYMTLPRELNGDATAFFTMFRNVFGSIGISISNAMIIERTQIHQSYLARWASLGSVGAPVKRGAEHQTESHSAAGDDTRKGTPARVGANNSVRSAA